MGESSGQALEKRPESRDNGGAAVKFRLTILGRAWCMKLVVAIIRPEKLEDVQAALNERDVYLITVSDVRGCGRQRGYTEVYRGTEIQVRLLPKLKLEIAVNDAFVEATVEAIVHAARTPDTGQVGDGKIFVLPLEDCIRIRTGERGGEAIGP
jgi:nitrogen regulatory protein P-II 1